MASHHLIDAHLGELAGRLPADVVDELADGLRETWHHHLDQGLTPTAAAHAAITEFGTPIQITQAFVAQATGRRTARVLLATGPVVGACWATSLITARAWTWPVPAAVAAGLALGLVTIVACLVAAATSRHSYRRARLGDLGAAGIVALDLTMIAVLILAAPVLVWPMTVAVPASLIRMTATLRRLPHPRGT